MRTYGAFESVKQQHVRYVGWIAIRGSWRIEPMNLEEIIIWCFPSFHACPYQLSPAGELAPECLRVRAGHPPGGSIMNGNVTHPVKLARMEVQIFGTRKSSDTRKAQRFFAERRVKIHFVDLNERAASLGELRRFAQKFGVGSLIDRKSPRYLDLGLQHARMSDDSWLTKLADEPLLLTQPMVRFGQKVTIGLAEPEWKAWVASAG